MLTTQQIRRIADQSGARDIEKVEVDIILTHLLQLFHEQGITEHVAFKGGTMLRKMVFGPRGRYSTDLDFTLCSNFTDEQVMEMIQDALHAPWQGISFKLADKDWGFTDGSFFANPVCSHAGNEKGIKINIQVSLREKPVLSVRPLPQIVQGYFKELHSSRPIFAALPTRRSCPKKSALPRNAPKSATFTISRKRSIRSSTVR